MLNKGKTSVFNSDFEYLDAEFEWLQARCARISSERWQNADSVSDRNDRLKQLRRTEQSIRASVDERLSATHQKEKYGILGVERLEHRFDLDGTERLFLIVLLLECISEGLKSSVMGELTTYGGIAIEELVKVVMDPNDSEGWVIGRSYFEDDSKLIKQGLISIDFITKPNYPDALMRATAHLTDKSFNSLVGKNGLPYP